MFSLYIRSNSFLCVNTTDHYEEEVIEPAPIITPDFRSTIQKFEPISELDEAKEKGASQIPKPMLSLAEIRGNIVTLRLSTWQNKEKGEKGPSDEPPYQRTVIRAERELSDPDMIEEVQPGRKPKGSGGWKTKELAKELSAKLIFNPTPIGKRDSLQKKLPKNPTRPARKISDLQEEPEEPEEESNAIVDETDSQHDRYGRVAKYMENPDLIPEEDDLEILEEVQREEQEEKRSSGELTDEERNVKPSNPLIGGRPLPKPNEETDWKNIG